MVPPVLVTNDGISWVSSKIGKPINKFVRDGLNVKVCLLRDGTKPCPEEVRVEVDDGLIEVIEVQRVQAREYKKVENVEGKSNAPVTVEQKWVVKDPGKAKEVEIQVLPEASTSGEKEVVEGPVQCDTPDMGDKGTDVSKNGTGTSKTKKRRKNRKKNLDKMLQVASASQLTVLPVNDVHPGNVSASPLGGTEAPMVNTIVQGAGGGPGNDSKASLQVEGSPGQLSSLSSPIEANEEEGVPIECSETEKENISSDEYEEVVKVPVKVKQKVSAGVKTRNKRR
ncbi:hypothetical protein LINPERPRIM_LOCUS20454 [Linum perenne]